MGREPGGGTLGGGNSGQDHLRARLDLRARSIPCSCALGEHVPIYGPSNSGPSTKSLWHQALAARQGDIRLNKSQSCFDKGRLYSFSNLANSEVIFCLRLSLCEI